MTLIGREESHPWGKDNTEREWWIGKPWRRLELVMRDTFYRGERVGRGVDVSGHLGIRRLGLGGDVRVFYQAGLDYSDEPHQ